MSLRVRLILLIGFVLSCSLLVGGLLAWRHAERRVRIEMAAALEVGRQNLAAMLSQHPGAAPDDVRDVIAAFDGDRHLEARLLAADGGLLAASRLAVPPRRPPGWFERALGIAPQSLRRDLPGGGAIVLETDPLNEIGEVWTENRDVGAILALFCIATALVVPVTVGWTLRPLSRLAAGFQAIGAGDYGTRVPALGPPELASLARDFNRMAELLAELERRNARLNRQLLTLEEEERADLARDLHDEVGPFLFAMKVDAAAVVRLAGPDSAEIRERVAAIEESIAHVQRHVKAILARLRPAALSDFGLGQAAANLASFWHHRHPEIRFAVAIPPTSFGDRLDEAIYRVVQESVSNAVRHGAPRLVEIAVEASPTEIAVMVRDDGSGLAALPEQLGYGLTGMRERVEQLGGVLAVGRHESGGTVVTARLPRMPEAALDMPAATA